VTVSVEEHAGDNVVATTLYDVVATGVTVYVNPDPPDPLGSGVQLAVLYVLGTNKTTDCPGQIVVSGFAVKADLITPMPISAESIHEPFVATTLNVVVSAKAPELMVGEEPNVPADPNLYHVKPVAFVVFAVILVFPP